MSLLLRKLGRGLQVAGLTILPVAAILELSGALGRTFGLNEMLWALVFGVASFGCGRIIEGYAGPTR